MKNYLRVYLAFLAVLGLCATASAQIVIEPELRTDTVDVFQPVVESSKSRTLAMVGSLVLPGLGHAYLGKDRAAMAFFTSEALLTFGAIFCQRSSRKLFGDAQAYAYLHAGLKGGPGADEFFWKAVGSFMGSKEFNDVMDLNRSPDQKLLADNLYWRWDDQSSMEYYAAQRETATRFHIASSFFIAGMVLDRVIAFVQIRQATRHRAVAVKGVEMRPSLAFSTSGAAFAMHGSF